MPSRSRYRKLFTDRPFTAVLPFLTVAVIATLSVWLPPTSGSTDSSWVVIGGLAAITLICMGISFVPHTHWAVSAAPLVFFAVVAVLRDATGGDGSHLTTLILLPVLWVVLYGKRWQLFASAAITALMFAVPIIAIGPPKYDSSGWRPGLLWVLLIVLVCPQVQRVVKRMRASEHASRALAGELASVLRAATEHAIVATDMGGRITLFSVGAERMLGYSAQEMLGRRLSEVHDEQELAAKAAELHLPPGMQVLRHGASVDNPTTGFFTYRRKDRSTLRVRLTVTPLMSESQMQTGWMGIARDVTLEEQVQQELEIAERRWRTLLANLRDVTVMVVGEELRYLLVTGSTPGAENERYSGKTLYETSNATNVKILEPIYRAALAGHPGGAELERSTDGAIIEMTASPLPHHEGRAEALVMVRDVTAARQAADELRGARDRFARLFTETPHGTLLLDADGLVSQINPALCLLVRGDSETLLGRPLHAGVLGELIEPAALADLLAGRETRLSAERSLRGEGEDSAHVSVTFVVLRAPGGEVDSLLATVVDVSERRRYEQQLARLAETDPLTGLANRRKFDSELTAHLERCRRYGPKGALLLLDLDDFKQTNDTLGHGAGDQLIISVANTLRHRLRSSDIVARLGGDEFAILLPEGDRASTERVAHDVVKVTRDMVTLLDGTRPRKITSSVGAVPIENATMSAGELLSLADMTMYDAKEAGRDRYIVYNAAQYPRPRTGARIAWTERIVRALEDDRFVVHAQPILDLASGRIDSAELLLRMRDDGDSLIMPGRFLYIAEQTSLITDIDCFMLTRAVQALERVQRTDPEFTISVNLSGSSIGHARVAALIADLMTADVNPNGLILEITETTAISNIEHARSFAESIREIGCRFALDDFGAGFGSFYYLKHLLFDYVKIDGEFVAQSAGNPTDRLIISSIVDIARGLGKQTIAEHVADQAILDIVSSLGVDRAQGFHVGRPEDLLAFFDRFAGSGVWHGETTALGSQGLK